MTNSPEDSPASPLFADEFVADDAKELIHFNCGNETWAKAANEWISGSDVWESITRRGTRVWLCRNDVGVVVGFASLGITRRKWPPPHGGYCNFLFIPMLGLDVAFRGKPLNAKVRYSNQIIKHVLHEAELLFAEHRKESRETLALIALLVHADNSRAISVYTRFGFEIEVRGTRGELLLMTRPLLSVE